MTQHPKLGVKPDALSVVRCRDYHGHYYIEGAPFRISFWTYGTDIDADEAQRRLDFANELVAAWNAREAAEAASKAREAALVEALTPSGDTKAAYHGEFSFQLFRGVSDAGIDQYEKVYVPWTTVKEIMAAISARAALTPKEPGA